MNQKQLWDKLAKENSKYYINSDYGKGITEDEFRESGERDVRELIEFDDNITYEGAMLEIGCGNGRMTEFLDKLFWEVYAVDISGEMIQQGKERLEELETIKWLETDGYTFPLEDNSVDFVFSYIVFQHFKTMEMVESNFKEVYRVLKPEGLFKVRVRSDKVDVKKWWGGVDCDEKVALNAGFKLIKKEAVDHYGLWLWLRK